ncbi:unnamed protein product [Urochloa humidicola]
MAGYRVGDPALRPDHDSVHIPTSFEIERELRDWEGNALVTWAMRVPPSTTARNLEDAIIAEFRLRQGDVDVTRHCPEAFLIRFQHRRHCEEVNSKGRFSYRGIEVCVRPWRSLTGALSASLFYRVRLVLDGVPRHAWQPDIVERLIGRTCALQCVDTNLLHPTDTRGIELWAWTADPSKIPKVMWLIFTTGTLEGLSSSVQISEIPPSRWQLGINHPVLVHIWEIHNYASVKTDPHAPDVAIGEPECRRLPWFWGVKDGDQEPTPAFPPFQHPPPPRVTERRDERLEADRRDRERQDRIEEERRAREDDHPDYHDMRGRRRDDHDDDRDHDGRDPCNYGRNHDTRGARRDAPRRERTRSPRRRDAGHGTYGGRRRATSPTAEEIEERRKKDLTLMFKLKVATMEQAASRVFNLQGNRPRPTAAPRSPLQLFQYISRMAEEDGNESWYAYNNNRKTKVLRARTHPPVPVQRVFYRIKNVLPSATSPTIQEVDAALAKLVDDAQPQMATSEPATPIQAASATSEPPTPTLADHVQVTPPDALLTTPLQATAPTNINAQVCNSTPIDSAVNGTLSGVADLFATPDQAVLSQPAPAPAKKGRRLKKPTVAVASLRRSKRQAVSHLKHMPAEQRANHVLCRRLGYIKDDLTPAEEAIREFIASFQGPIPQDIMAALTAIFRLDNDDINSATEALIRLGGPEAADGLPELNGDDA